MTEKEKKNSDEEDLNRIIKHLRAYWTNEFEEKKIGEQARVKMEKEWKDRVPELRKKLEKKTIKELRKYKLYGLPRSPKSAIIDFILEDFERSNEIDILTKPFKDFICHKTKQFNQLSPEEQSEYLTPVAKWNAQKAVLAAKKKLNQN